MRRFLTGIAWTATMIFSLGCILFPDKNTLDFSMLNFLLFWSIMGFWFLLGDQNGKNPETEQQRPVGGLARENRRSFLPTGHHFHPILGNVICVDKECTCNSIKAERKFGNEWHYEVK